MQSISAWVVLPFESAGLALTGISDRSLSSFVFVGQRGPRDASLSLPTLSSAQENLGCVVGPGCKSCFALSVQGEISASSLGLLTEAPTTSGTHHRAHVAFVPCSEPFTCWSHRFLSRTHHIELGQL